MDEDQAFMSNLKGSAMANIVTGLFILCIWILKNKCKHSQCKMDNSCFQCSVKEDDECENDLERGERGERFGRQQRQNTIKIEGRMQKMHKGFDDGILPKHKKTSSTD